VRPDRRTVAAYSTAKARAAPARIRSRSTGIVAASVATVRRAAANRSSTWTAADPGAKTTVAAARLIEPATGVPASISARPVARSSDALTG
jgi:hypothetical protein